MLKSCHLTILSSSLHHGPDVFECPCWIWICFLSLPGGFSFSGVNMRFISTSSIRLICTSPMSTREICYKRHTSNSNQEWVDFQQRLDNHLREPAAGHWKRFVGQIQRGVESWRERSNHNHLLIINTALEYGFGKNWCEKLSSMLIVRAEEKGQITIISLLSTQF